MSLPFFIITNDMNTSIFSRWRKDKVRVLDIITQEIIPDMSPSMLNEKDMSSYPWCFAFPVEDQKHKSHYAGAFVIIRREQDCDLLIAICVRAPNAWLKQNLASEYSVAFWMSRILSSIPSMYIAERNWTYIQDWVSALRRAYSYMWQSILLVDRFKFKNRSSILLKTCSVLDYQIKASDGVDVMPWNNWPDCISHKNKIWLWRQSRHLKFLDSQTLNLPDSRAAL